MSAEAIRQGIITEVERARTAWSAYTLLVDYENRDLVDLEAIEDGQAYLAVDIVFLSGNQLDLGQSPMIEDAGHIILAAGAKMGAGTAQQVKLLDHVRPYLQLRDDLGIARTEAGKLQRPQMRQGFYYLPLIVPFWSHAQAPDTP